LSVSADNLQHFLAACEEELQVPKPGNVHIYAAGHGMSVLDFQVSAAVSGPFLCQAGASLGARIGGSVQATRAAVGQNTNLGIVLLCAPLALAAERGCDVADVISGSTLADAEAVFEAIRIAAPGGLGRVEQHDVHAPATVLLPEAMRAAAARDSIARQWSNGFADVLGPGLTIYRAAPNRWASLIVYLYYLATMPDSHVLRKFGAAAAAALQLRARDFRDAFTECDDLLTLLPQLLEWDGQLKAEGINPGTSADLCVATAFADRLQKGGRRRNGLP
jgi:triphosphoribosyl-dephospho-CoA synthase